jgi:hypothetical protein
MDISTLPPKLQATSADAVDATITDRQQWIIRHTGTPPVTPPTYAKWFEKVGLNLRYYGRDADGYYAVVERE